MEENSHLQIIFNNNHERARIPLQMVQKDGLDSKRAAQARGAASGTGFFRMMNPEVMADPRKKGSWLLVGGVWVAMAALVGGLRFLEQNRERKLEAERIGPRKRGGGY